jgi:hypothetical protein
VLLIPDTLLGFDFSPENDLYTSAGLPTDTLTFYTIAIETFVFVHLSTALINTRCRSFLLTFA